MAGWLLVQRSDADDADVQRVDALVHALGSSATVRRTEDGGALEAALAELEDRTLVVGGGDGSLHLAVNLLDRAGRLQDTRVALLPAGTGNDLARTLGASSDPRAVAEALVAGRVRPLDVLRVVDAATGTPRSVCVNAIHTGVGFEAAERAADLKDPLGDLAYPVGSLVAGATADGWRVAVEVDGRQISRDETVLMVAVMNGRTVGGGHALAPDADPADGLADVVVSHAVAPSARAAYGLAVTRGTHLDRDDVLHVRGQEVTLRGENPGYNVDGELWPDVPGGLRVRVERGALQLVVAS